MNEFFLIYSIYPMQCLWALFFGILISFLCYRINSILGYVSLIMIQTACFIVIEKTGANLTQLYSFILPLACGQLYPILKWGRQNTTKSRASKTSNIMRVEMMDDRKKKHYIDDLNRGVAIFGSSGAGKSASVIYFLMKHLSKNKFSGIINDYKDYELSEIAYPLFLENGVDFKVFALHDVNRSVRINVIDPGYIESMSDVTGIVAALMLNLSQENESGGTSKFFREGAESLLCGVIWRLKKEYPQYCNLPFVIALLLSTEGLHDTVYVPGVGEQPVPFGRLSRFLKQDKEAEIASSVFLTGVCNERQTAALYSTLASSLRKLASPEIFYLLGDNDINLDLNSDNSRAVLSFINKPGALENVISPINAMIIEGCFTAMSNRGRKPSFVLLDEAPTIKIMGLGRRIATLRSYGVSFIYCMQDKIQGMAQWNGKDYMTKEILTNLSTQFMGKVNDADTAKYYEKFFEIVKENQRSVSKGESSWLSSANKGEIRVTTSQKEKSKVRGYEFFQLKQGEFIMFADGRDDRFRFHYTPPVKRLPSPCRAVTRDELQDNFTNLLDDASSFLRSIL